MSSSGHPVGRLLVDAAAGRFPPADGRCERVEPWRPGLAAVVAFTGHAVVALPRSVELPPSVEARIDGFGGAHDPRVAAAIAGDDGWIDSLDAVLVRRGGGAEEGLVERPDLADHPRARFATRIRDDVRCLGERDGGSFVTVGRGLGGLTEVGIELEAAEGSGAGGGGTGRRLLGAALAGIPASETVVAAVAPGNARALRAFLGAGFVPVASVQLIMPG